MPEISKAYEPQAVESKWYQSWLDRQFFVADPARVTAKRSAYSIVIPPPNVTGVLTLGHVLNNTIQDILARKARMEGREVLWLPGTDHAGIATQAVVEKTLRKEGVMRHRDDLGREKFLEHVWAWKEKHGGIIIQQLRKLGCSCDWTRERFTMDPAYSQCVQRVFAALYRKGLIYRGKRMVNWDPAARTALSDEEVEMIEEKGHLWHIKYPLLDEAGQPKSGEFVVVRIVGRGDLHAAGAELGIDKVVRDNGDELVLERQQASTADERGVAGIVRVHRHGFVPEHGFGPGGGDNDELAGLRLTVGVE